MTPRWALAERDVQRPFCSRMCWKFRVLCRWCRMPGFWNWARDAVRRCRRLRGLSLELRQDSRWGSPLLCVNQHDSVSRAHGCSQRLLSFMSTYISRGKTLDDLSFSTFSPPASYRFLFFPWPFRTGERLLVASSW